jgi:hypothetical protein
LLKDLNFDLRISINDILFDLSKLFSYLLHAALQIVEHGDLKVLKFFQLIAILIRLNGSLKLTLEVGQHELEGDDAMALVALPAQRTNQSRLLALLLNADQVQTLTLVLLREAADIRQFRIGLLCFHYMSN